ncbi:transcriptional regulator, TetR family [Segniliparus rotundus DSM 44985]|uniref:Transcriptional regulator, TetR family n=1 Tax=Segniliparus rotundus (strain ATCC BAA-972 / CDC 1076 / CIP 108378 / DSM 44985 / JCM 13578) TaxID=640132 RepID=D6ZEF4_SEGRD|nr:TetR/AcrR family transcriptional regulator [Segniliparus rotundus]ADG99430.1 transcriptional regulator, TetR family [Segniliparus rotundus DSM 44985]
MTQQAVEGSLPARRPLRADAAQNRARLLSVAYEAFAELGIGAPVDEIARRAGVGAGTVYRHFPTKEQLFLAVVMDRVDHILARAEEVLRTEPAGEAFFTFFTEVIDQAAVDHGLSDALESSGVELPEVEDRFRGVSKELVERAQRAGTLRADLVPDDVKFLLKACFAAQRYLEDQSRAAFLTSVVLDGMRTCGAVGRTGPSDGL